MATSSNTYFDFTPIALVCLLLLTSRLSSVSPTLSIDITRALINAGDFNIIASLLAESGVAADFEKEEGGAGITLLMPADAAFSNLPRAVNFQSLPADKKASVVKFHALHAYYKLSLLNSMVNPVQPTFATEEMGAGRFTLNISNVKGSAVIDTGIGHQASVTTTVLDQKPVAIFGVSDVLLPKEMFGEKPIVELI